MVKYLLILVVFTASLLSGCGTVTSNVKGDKLAANSNRQTKVSSQPVSSTSGLQKGSLVPLKTASNGQDVMSAMVPIVLKGIDYAQQQGSLKATQDLKTDGALTVDEKGRLTLLLFLKPNSLISYSDTYDYVKGDRDVGFLWSCIQEKLQQKFTDPKVYSPELINSFNITYFNTKGDKLSIVMPGNDPEVTLNGEPIVFGDSTTQDLIKSFFSTTY